MATRTPPRARDDARAASTPDENAGTGAAAAPDASATAPAAGFKAWRRLDYTEELLAECRHRYEQTRDSIVSIARDCGISDKAVTRMARKYGWTRCRRVPVDLPEDTKLRRRAETLAEQTTAAAGDEATVAVADTADDILREVQVLLADVRALREQMHGRPQTYTDITSASRALSNLSATVGALKRMQRAPGAAVAPSGVDDDDDMPRDIDEFRRELARRINEFVRSRTEPDDAGGGGEDSASRVDEV